jgi:hypothetical protein
MEVGKPRKTRGFLISTMPLKQICDNIAKIVPRTYLTELEIFEN